MTPAQLDLARALVALPGMPALDDAWEPFGSYNTARVIAGPLSGARVDWASLNHPGPFLDLTDAATEGALLRMLWAVDPGAWARHDQHRGPGVAAFTVVLSSPDRARADGHTLGEAVARALLAVGRCS